MSHERSAGAHLRAFLGDPKGVSALFPTSAPVVERIVSKIPSECPGLIVEYGPGSGVVTRRLLDRLCPEGKLVAVESNRTLARRLGSALDDPRLMVVHDSAQEVDAILDRLGLGPADVAVSGIPFSWFAPATALAIVTGTHQALRDGGRFVTYQTFYQRRRFLRAHLERCFSTVRSEIDLRNLPPYRICEAIK